MLKNRVYGNTGHALGLPTGTTAIRPDSSVIGQARWNTTTTKLEYYNGSVWQSTAHEGNVTITKDSFSGTSSQQTFTMSYSYASGQEPQVLIFVGQVYQNPGVAYTFNGTSTITFTAAPATGTNNILLLHNFASTIAV